MNTALLRALKGRNVLFLLLFISFSTLIFGCEDPGVVGGGFTDSGTSIEVDTLEVNGFESESYNFYSGNFSYISIGQFSDPLFGDMNTKGLIRPQLLSSSEEFVQDASMKLRLLFDQEYVYGDSSQTAEFDIYELDQVWRGNAWKLYQQPEFNDGSLVGSFTVEEQDSIEISLSDTWIQKYRLYVSSEDADRDSLYRINFPGLAIVPKNTSKIVPVQASSSKFIIENPESDTLQVRPRDWAYSLQRTNETAAPEGTSTLHSTYEQVVNFDMDLSRENLGSVNLSKVELVLYEHEELLESTMDQVSASAGRAKINGARLHLVEPDEVPIGLQSGSVLANGQYNDEDGSFRFDITSFTSSVLLDELNSELRFYVTIETNNGIVRSSLIYNDQASKDKRPKLIVTYVKNQ